MHVRHQYQNQHVSLSNPDNICKENRNPNGDPVTMRGNILIQDGIRAFSGAYDRSGKSLTDNFMLKCRVLHKYLFS